MTGITEAFCSAMSRVGRVPYRGRRGVCGSLLTALFLLSSSALLPGAGNGEQYIASRLPLMLDRPADLPRSLFPFRSYGSASGLDNLAVHQIAQDSTGFLWVGTEDGLYRYSGERFTKYDASSGLPSAWITDLLATPDGDLWVCTPQGAARRRGPRFEPVLNGPCNAIARDSRGVIWIASRDGLFFQQDDRSRRLDQLTGPVTALVSLPPPSSAIYAAVRNTVFRVCDYRVKRRYPLAGAASVTALVVESSGKIWAQRERKLYALAPGAMAFSDESAKSPMVSSSGAISTDRSGRLWAPTDEGMSCRVGEGWQHFGVKDGMPTDWSRCIFEDREGSLWVGSLGVHRLVGRGAWTSWTRTHGLPSDTVWDVHRARDGRLWVATNKGLCLAAPNGWKTLQGTVDTAVQQIYEDSKGVLWLASSPAAVLRYDPRSGSLQKFGESSGVRGASVLSIAEDGQGQVWAATAGAGVLRYHHESLGFVREPLPGGAPEETFGRILCDHRNRLWVAGESGLLLRSQGKWRRFGRKDGLLREGVEHIAESRSGDLYLSYFEPLGIVQIGADGERLTIRRHLTQKDGLSSEKVTLMSEDLNRDLWVGTGKGIDILSPSGVFHISKDEGIFGNGADATAILVEANGSVFVGASSGLCMYRGDADLDLTRIPKPIILSAALGDKPLLWQHSSLQKFSHDANTLKAEFAVLSFIRESQIQYSARLRGLENEWHDAQLRTNRYAGLAPGIYTYEVRARVDAGPWSEPAAIQFEIKQPWWRTWPAMATWLLLVGAAALGGICWRLRHLRTRTRQLEGLVSARTVELAMANADLERLSITDPLTGLKNRRFLEFSIAEDLARLRRSYQLMEESWGQPEERPDISFLLVDIDHFKLINDDHGHPSGDQVLRKMGAVLSSVVRESDTVVRWGGEEFLIVARSPKGNDPAALSERVRRKVESTSFRLAEGQTTKVTCSIGFASWPFFRHEPEALTWTDVLGLADRCLYLAKNSGRNAWIGARARAEYRGATEPALLNDFRTANLEGLLDLQSSLAQQPGTDVSAPNPIAQHEGARGRSDATQH